MLFLYFVIVRVVIQRFLMQPIESCLINKGVEIVIRNFKAIAFVMWRIARDAARTNAPELDAAREFTGYLFPAEDAAVFNDENFRVTFKKMEKCIADGVSKLQKWASEWVEKIRNANDNILRREPRRLKG